MARLAAILVVVLVVAGCQMAPVAQKPPVDGRSAVMDGEQPPADLDLTRVPWVRFTMEQMVGFWKLWYAGTPWPSVGCVHQYRSDSTVMVHQGNTNNLSCPVGVISPVEIASGVMVAPGNSAVMVLRLVPGTGNTYCFGPVSQTRAISCPAVYQRM